MKLPIVNLNEQIGKTVGRIHNSTPDYDRLATIAEALMPRLAFPKGVYRLHTFEEADLWTEQHILTEIAFLAQKLRT